MMVKGWLGAMLAPYQLLVPKNLNEGNHFCSSCDITIQAISIHEFINIASIIKLQDLQVENTGVSNFKLQQLSPRCSSTAARCQTDFSSGLAPADILVKYYIGLLNIDDAIGVIKQHC